MAIPHKNGKQPNISFINYQALLLDRKNNPRLPSELEGAEETDILNYMVRETSLLELMKSIGESGFFSGEPLLVVESNEKGKYVVVEGNRRLSAVLLLHNPKKASVRHKSLTKIADETKEKPEELPVIVYKSRDDILDYLGFRHITGIKQWDALAKAKYLRQLYERSVGSAGDNPIEISKELARIIGSRPDYVRKLLCALNVYDVIQDNNFYDIKGLDKNVSESFSLITTALGYRGIQDFLGLDSGEDIPPENIDDDNLKNLTTWMFDKSEGRTRIGESRNLGQLAEILKNKDALDDFRNGATLENAYLASGGAKDAVAKAIKEAHDKLELAYKYVRGLILEPDALKMLDEILNTTKSIKKVATPSDDD